MNVPYKSRWTVTASGGDPRAAIDDSYSTRWICGTSKNHWLEIDLGQTAILGGLEVYWGRRGAKVHSFESSLDGRVWTHLCATRHGEGGLEVFAFPPREARFVRWTFENPEPEHSLEVVEINLYGPDQAASVREPGRIPALGHAPVKIPPGDSITVDFGYIRSPLGVLVQWGETYGTDFSVHLSDDGENFREVGHITLGNGGYDSFYWRTTTARYLRFTVHEASSRDGAIIDELKLRILNKDRMPIGQLERAARAGRSELYPQSLLGRQIYWTAFGEIDQAEQALFDEYGNLEPLPGSGQITPLLRLDGTLHGAPAAAAIEQTLMDGALPMPSVTWLVGEVEVEASALVDTGQAVVEYRVTNRADVPRQGTLVLALRPVQINPYWQHGGHAITNAIAVEGRDLWVNDRRFARFSREPDFATVAEFQDGDVVKLIEHAPQDTERSLRSDSGLLSAACEFEFSLNPGESASVVMSAFLRDGIVPDVEIDFPRLRDEVAKAWREKVGPRRITVGDREVSDTVEAQIGLILVNSTRYAFKPGPRNYDRTWIRDGSSQALALLYAGLIEDAKRYVLWYAERIYDNGMVPPILNPDGSVNRGYGSDIEFDAQGQFVAIAAEVYRFSRDRGFLEAIFEPVVRATRFIEELCARTNALYGPETRFHGLLAPSLSHEGYNKPTYSYWDDFFALRAWRDCAYLATEIGDADTAAWAQRKGEAFATNLARSLRMTTEELGTGLIHASADREDVDPTSTSIAFEPCRVEDVLPAEYLQATYDLYCEHLDRLRAADFSGGFTPYEIRNLNAFVALGRIEDAFRLLADALTWRRPAGWRHWAEVVWADPRVPDYIGDMPHTWIGAEFATAIRRMLVRENCGTLELFRAVPDSWWEGGGISLNALPTTFGRLDLEARRGEAQVTVDLRITGTTPERIVLRYPGARRAQADGNPCDIDGDVVMAPNFNRLVIEL
ncbi:discoidin domain-containing protein [Methylocaldum szegediense]|uniref:discoidin domain-containing protein n=1 Tax=Methylocaldum szegediense TaxID=73780 RepID=UPI000426A68C|nr:discoidin domain-containing protein [Methylocaldum szegediense]